MAKNRSLKPLELVRVVREESAQKVLQGALEPEEERLTQPPMMMRQTTVQSWQETQRLQMTTRSLVRFQVYFHEQG